MDNPLSVQELMVVTFHKAAAQEMSVLALPWLKPWNLQMMLHYKRALNDSSICCPRLIFLHYLLLPMGDSVPISIKARH